MKTIVYYFIVFLFTFLSFSCSKDHVYDEGLMVNEEDESAQLVVQGVGTSSSHVVFSNGVYSSNFAGGIVFGSTFIHPTNKYDFQNYSPWSPVIGGVSSNALLLDTKLSGNKMTLVFGTAVNGLVYKMNVSDYFAAIRQNGSAPAVDDYVTRVGGSSNGLLVVAGHFFIDHSSPTGVSIFDGEVTPPSGPSFPTLISDFIVKDGNNYFVAIYEGTDELYQLTASLPETHPKAVESYDATYSNIDAQTILVVGEFETNDGTVYQLNETLSR